MTAASTLVSWEPVARKSSDDSSRRLKRKMESLAQNGAYKGGKRPFGFERDGTTLRSEEAALIREAAKRLLAGDSARGISADWNEAEVANRRWEPQALKRILSAPRVAGLREYKGRGCRRGSVGGHSRPGHVGASSRAAKRSQPQPTAALAPTF